MASPLPQSSSVEIFPAKLNFMNMSDVDQWLFEETELRQRITLLKANSGFTVTYENLFEDSVTLMTPRIIIIALRLVTDAYRNVAAIDASITERDVFKAMVEHEMGHSNCYVNKRDFVDELLAWELAEQQLGVPKTKALKEYILQSSSYRWYIGRTKLLKKAVNVASAGTCPDCNQPGLTSHVYADAFEFRISEYWHACFSCGSQFIVRRGGGHPATTGIWRLHPDHHMHIVRGARRFIKP